MMDSKKKIVTLLVSMLLTGWAGGLWAAGKTDGSFHEFDLWHKLLQYSISSDGEWAMWRIQSGQETDTLFIRNMKSGQEYSYGNASIPQFSEDARYVVFSLPCQEKNRSGVSYQIRLVDLQTGEEKDFYGMESFSFTVDSRYLILKGRSAEAVELNLYHLNRKILKNLANIGEYAVDPTGKFLAYTVKTPNGLGNGIEIMELADFRLIFPENTSGEYEKLKWTEQGLVYLKILSDSLSPSQNREIRVIREMNKHQRIFTLSVDSFPDFPDHMKISPYDAPRWSKDGKILFFGISGKQKIKEEGEDAKADVDIWHWQDQEIQSRQKNRYYLNRSRTYLCAWWPEQQQWKRIADTALYEITGISPAGTYVLAEDDKPYRPHYREQHHDIYLIHTLTGKRVRLLENTILSATFSQEGKYVSYFKDKNWWAYEVGRERYINLTAGITTGLSDTHYDGPIDIAPSFGVAGWTAGDRAFCFYDEYDIWKVEPENLRITRLTNGREKKMTFRKWQRGALALDRNLLLKADGADGQTRIYRFDPKLQHQLLAGGPYTYLRWDKASRTDAWVLGREDNAHSPELFFCGGDFDKLSPLTRTNLNHPDFQFRRSELIRYENTRGQELKGALFYPVNYREGVKYPMIVSIYETLSQQLNSFVFPSAGDAYNTTNYVLDGYFVFQPDITYEINHPGESAVDCITAAIQKVLKKKDIDPQRLGLIGHSWGAYQTAYVITQTPLFAAAVAGAPLTNMISMYNSIYWENGRPNQEMFETSQARFRLPWWEIPDAYIKNSPVFQAQHIQTPLLMLFGIEDNAVHWSQGLELYITMRRLGKPCILVAYPTEGHTIGLKANKLDQTSRVMDYFDYYLKGNARAGWILKGRSYLEKKGEE